MIECRRNIKMKKSILVDPFIAILYLMIFSGIDQDTCSVMLQLKVFYELRSSGEFMITNLFLRDRLRMCGVGSRVTTLCS